MTGKLMLAYGFRGLVILGVLSILCAATWIVASIFGEFSVRSPLMLRDGVAVLVLIVLGGFGVALFEWSDRVIRESR
jgi:hypothetical protein